MLNRPQLPCHVRSRFAQEASPEAEAAHNLTARIAEWVASEEYRWY